MTDIFARAFAPAPTGFTGAPLDRVDDIRRDPDLLWAARMRPDARWLAFDELKPMLTDAGDAIAWQRRIDLPDDVESVFLGLEDGAPRFAVGALGEDMEGEVTDARAAAMRMPASEAATIAIGRSLVDWHARHGFCAVCGAPTVMRKAGYARSCEGCGAEHFPRTDPVV
ncbi:MAG: NADH pyrophosphatase zinc ribbon domain-containing protein, partial [Pacificimonas sp.]